MPTDLFANPYNRDELAEFAAREGDLTLRAPLCPLDTVGIPRPGPDFVRAAEAIAGGAAFELQGKGKAAFVVENPTAAPLKYLYWKALYQKGFHLPVRVKGNDYLAPFLSGTYWGYDQYGPRRDFEGPEPGESIVPRVMVVGKNPGYREIAELINFSGPAATPLKRALVELGIAEDAIAEWYCTNLIKHARVDPASETIAAGLIANCAPLLAIELRLIRPEFVLCLGTEAIKAVLGKGENVSKMLGRVADVEVPLHRHGEEPAVHRARAMGIVHPGSVVRYPEQHGELRDGVASFFAMTTGGAAVVEEEDVDHVRVYTERALADAVDAAIADPEYNAVAVDLEWQGKYPTEAGSYVRTVQFSTRPGTACCVVLRNERGEPCFLPDQAAAERQLRRLLARRGAWRPRFGGHFIRADIPWLKLKLGIDPAAAFRPARSAEATKTEGGWDTGYMAHAVQEDCESFKLEVLAARFCRVPRYDIALQKWKDGHIKRLGIKDNELEGYGACPDDVLIPYSCLHGDSLVQLGDGSWEKIRTLVADRYDGLVRAFVNGAVVNARVTNWHRNDVGQEDWFFVKTPSTKGGRWGDLGPRFTPDHKVLTRRGKVRVDQLRPGADAILTDEREFTSQQLSVFLGSLIGDGGFVKRNANGVGFGLGQRDAVAAYADWKADVFSTHAPSPRKIDGQRRYELAFSKYLLSLSDRFPVKPAEEHGKRKGVISADLLANLGMLGLAVWYQDDGTLVTDKRDGHMTSRIYCRINEDEEVRVVLWLSANFGPGVSYNRNAGFIQISRDAFAEFHRAIDRYIHPRMAYKVPETKRRKSYEVGKKGLPFYETVTSVDRATLPAGRRGHGVRFCLTVEGAGNFLTKAGFVSNCWDADATIRLFYKFNGLPGARGLLDVDQHGNSSRPAFQISQQASAAFLDMEMTGVSIDRRRGDAITDLFLRVRDRLIDRFQTRIRWRGFNPGSAHQCREFLYGERHNGTVDKATGGRVRLRPDWNPEGDRPDLEPYQPACLGLTPIKAAGAKGKTWERVVADGETHIYNPSTDKETLGILGNAHPLVAELRDIRFIAQVLKGVLRKPRQDGRGEFLEDDEENWEYDGGLLYWAMKFGDDWRVRTHFYPVETGRCSSSRPNLQNISKRREGDYEAILGVHGLNPKTGKVEDHGRYLDFFGRILYPGPIRSIVRATPGRVLIEADYKGAELAAIAWLAGCKRMIADIERNALDEDHPDYLCLHCQTAIRAFHLVGPNGEALAPNKKSLKLINRMPLRTGAKTVNFSVPYQSGPGAIARKCREEGADVSEDEARALIDGYYELYPENHAFLEECMARVSDPGWISGTFGRYRRFARTDDESVLAEMQRQACNYPIQNCVADTIALAMHDLFEKRRREEEATGRRRFDFCLQIHDALLFECDPADVEWTIEEAIKPCMTGVAVWPRNLDGTPRADVKTPYHFGIDVEVFESWGVKLKKDRARALGVPDKYAA